MIYKGGIFFRVIIDGIPGQTAWEKVKDASWMLSFCLIFTWERTVVMRPNCFAI